MKCIGRSNNIGTLINYGSYSLVVGDRIPYFNPGSSLSITKVACLNQGVCILLNTGSIKCVGDNTYGQVGIGVTNLMIGESSGYVGDALPAVNLGTGVITTDIYGGFFHVCALTSDKKVKCYGRAELGEIASGDFYNRGTSLAQMGDRLPFIDFGTNITVASIHSGSASFHNCVILASPTTVAQRFKCWGLNASYQLGYIHNVNVGASIFELGDYLPLVNLGTESRAQQIAVGLEHTCALLIDGMLKCWGSGGAGQLGSGGTRGVSLVDGGLIPYVSIDFGKEVKLVSAGWYHTCFVYDDAITMKCIGRNDNGQLGQGDTMNRGNSPETMVSFIPAINLGSSSSLNISSLHSGFSFNCVLYADHSAKCFGNNQYGQLGVGATDARGDSLDEIGSKLQFIEFFSPTRSPTHTPSSSPILPTKLPTSKTITSVPTLAAALPDNNSDAVAIGLGVLIPIIFAGVAVRYYLYKYKSNKSSTTKELLPLNTAM